MLLRESYQATLRETDGLIRCSPNQTSMMVRKVFQQYSLPETTVTAIDTDLHDTPRKLSNFLMSFHHQLVAPVSSRAYISAFTLAVAYFAGGFIPLVPYFCVKRNEVLVALYCSIGIMAVTLLAFGYLKTGFVRGWRGRQNVRACIIGGIQMLLVGGIAAGAAIGLVRAINAHSAPIET
jgi:vacuolar iron transporter family protein